MDVLSLRLFLRIAELGGVSAASRDLNLSPASASARLAKLEDTLGFRLFNRTTRAISLTTDGETFRPYAQQTLETLDAGVGAVTGQHEATAGRLRMTMPGSFGRMHIVPRLGDFQARYPLVSLDIRLSDEVLDVIEGAYDLIVRNAALDDSSFVARKLSEDERILVASPSYLARSGYPAEPSDLTNHKGIVLAGIDRWKFRNGTVVSPSSIHAVNDGEAVRAMVEQGMGIGLVSLWSVSTGLKAGRLVEVLPQYPLLSETSIWALYPSGRIVAPKVRAMIDFLMAAFSPTPPWKR